MSKLSSNILLLLLCVAVLIGLLYWLVATPKTNKLQPALEELSEFNYSTNLIIHKGPSLNELLLLRRLRDSEWQSSGEHTGYKLQKRKEPSMGVSTIKLDAYLKKTPDEPNKIIIGRLTDRGSGMHGWHVTMIKQGETEINFDRHQRYYVYIEKETPKGFSDRGEPISDDPKRWFFAGLADIIAKDKYNGYLEPAEGDK